MGFRVCVFAWIVVAKLYFRQKTMDGVADSDGSGEIHQNVKLVKSRCVFSPKSKFGLKLKTAKTLVFGGQF